MKKPTIADWLKSRTIRINMLFMAIYPTVVAIPAETWLAMGISSEWSHRLPVLIGMLQALANARMRQITNRPLAGRSD